MAATSPPVAPGRLPRTVRLFASAATVPRARRIIDGLTLAAALALLALLAWWGQPTRGFERSLVEAAASAPGWLTRTWVLLYDVMLILSAIVVVAAVARRRWAILLQCLVASTAAIALVMVVARLVGDAWPQVDDAVGIGSGVAWPAPALTIAAAILLGVGDDVTRPLRTFGIRAIWAGAIIAVLAGRTTVTGALAALLVAASAAAIARLAVGTSAGHMSRGAVLELLEALGVRVSRIVQLTRQADGLILVDARGARDEPLLVKVNGRDAAESRRALRLWRALAYRDGGAAFAQARSPGLVRETLATLLATTHGVPVWEVATGGRPDGADEALVLRVDGQRASQLAPGAFSDEAAASAWETLAALHAARIAHLGLDPTALALRADGTIALTDLTDASVAASEEAVRTDDAQLLACLAVLIGPERAIASARAALHDAHLAGLLPYLQPAAFPRDLRAAARAAKLDIDDLRAATAATAGIAPPELARLTRVTRGGLIRVGLLVLAAAALVPIVANVDYEQLRSALSSASWALVIVAFVVAQLPRLAQAVSTLGSVPARLPYGPVYMLQLATSFLNVALPSAAGRMALNVRFFQRQGIAPATAITSGLIDSFVGNIIQAVVLASLLLFTSMSLELEADFTFPDRGAQILVGSILLLVAITVAAGLAVPRVRRMVAARMRSWWPGVRAALAPLRTGHKFAQLIGGNLAAELLFAASLALFVNAFGGDIGLVEGLFVTMSASLLVTFVPIPGGIGIAEGALIVGLTSLGVDEETAFAATIFYRVSTFYLPPIWGWLALGWLGRKRYI